MEETFLSIFRGPIDPSTLYHKLATIKRGEGELIDNFNDRFQKDYSRLVAPYTVNADALLAMYYVALDPLTTMFVKRKPDIDTISKAYKEASSVNQEMRQTTYNPFPNGGNLGVQNQTQPWNGVPTHNTPLLNSVPTYTPMYNPAPI